MKTKQLLLSLSLLFVATINYAQASFTSAGIAVQGIARDANNTAIQDATVALEFSFFYYISGNENPVLSPFIKNVVTDNFGVFSTIIDPLADNNQLFSNYKVWLRIKNGTTVLSEAVLNHVPYAISANNGVPTGSIMPYMGNVEPTGWVMCNGQSITAINGSEALIAMVGNNAPNLQGMFLRGAGTNPQTPVTTVLGQIQDDAFEKHKHSDNFSIPSGGIHKHIWTESKVTVPAGADYGVTWTTSGGTAPHETTGNDGGHSHTLNGGITDSGTILETRPVNYGVNYIIKL